MTLHWLERGGGENSPTCLDDNDDEGFGVDLALTADQEMVRSATRAFLTDTCPVATTRALEGDQRGWDPAVWHRGAALGWTSPLVGEADGGGSVSGDGLADLAIVAEEMGRLVAPGPLVPTNVVADALGSLADAHRRRNVLGAILDGSATAAFTPVRPAGVPTVEAVHDGSTGAVVLRGEASPVESAVGAGWLLVAARGPGAGVTRALVATDAPGVTIRPLGGLDLVRRFASVRFTDVVVEAGDVVGDIDGSHDVLDRQLALAVVLQCAETVGALEAIFARTVEYLRDRYSFGRPLASYQALKHRCADLKLTVERCAGCATAAAQAVAAATVEAAEMVSIAKAFIGPAATEVVQECVQLHGGIGVTWDHDLHLYLRRVTVNRATYGTPAEHLERVATRAFAVREPS